MLRLRQHHKLNCIPHILNLELYSNFYFLFCPIAIETFTLLRENISRISHQESLQNADWNRRKNMAKTYSYMLELGTLAPGFRLPDFNGSREMKRSKNPLPLAREINNLRPVFLYTFFSLLIHFLYGCMG